MANFKKFILGMMLAGLMIPVTGCSTEENFQENEEQLSPVDNTGIRDSEHEVQERDEALNDLEEERGSYEHTDRED